MTIKFMYNGIKVDGKLYKAFYSETQLSGLPEGTITIYGRDYISFPPIPGLIAENDSDIMTDYFADDRIRVTPDNRYYDEVKNALDKCNERYARRARK